jgi:hypothetical protein
MKPKIPLNEMVAKFLKSKLCFHLVPLGSSATLPIPFRLKEKLYISLYFYTGRKIEIENKIKIYRPHTKVVLDYSTARIVNYFDLLTLKDSNSEHWKKPIGEFPHKEIETLSLNEYKDKKSELIALYDKIIELLYNNNSYENCKNDFRQRFYQICEPSLLPFLKNAGPTFFEWLNSE